jgi:signal transduction histidine kinase
VAQRLPGILDPVTIAGTLLTTLADQAPAESGAVLVRTGGQRLAPLAHFGAEPTDWRVSLAEDDDFSYVWASQLPRVSAAGSSVVLPLHIGLRTIGLVALGCTPGSHYDPDIARRLMRTVDGFALRLETALLFDEIREVATVEERHRLAREIHDGIAQELASLGYLVDHLVAQASGGASALEPDLRQLRGELTRLVSELRLSISDLRTDIDRGGGLAAALSNHVRAVAQDCGLTVHLTLDEEPSRLAAETEAELLRIAQEAIANARRHAHAENLWVSCTISPPAARLCIEDDGVGLGEPGHGNRSFGLEVMRERAERLRARLRIEPRVPKGTLVEVVLGNPTATDIVAGVRAARKE